MKSVRWTDIMILTLITGLIHIAIDVAVDVREIKKEICVIVSGEK